MWKIRIVRYLPVVATFAFVVVAPMWGFSCGAPGVGCHY